MSNLKRQLHLGLVAVAATMAIIVAVALGGPAPTAVVTVLMAIELTIRFRYVIDLLDWPVSPSRLLLLLVFWLGMVVLASQVGDPRRWGFVAATLFAAGVAIELHNLITRQWVTGDERFQRSLRNDILRGVAAASFAAISTPIVTARWPERIAMYVGGLIAADVVRFLEMVYRHRRFRRSS